MEQDTNGEDMEYIKLDDKRGRHWRMVCRGKLWRGG